jgi:hypothetical protein
MSLLLYRNSIVSGMVLGERSNLPMGCETGEMEMACEKRSLFVPST